MTRNLFCLLMLIGVFFCAAVSAQPEMDASFASGGKLMPQIGASGSTQELLIQPDDKIVLIGSCYQVSFGYFPFCQVRLNPDGSFDTSLRFGVATNGGYVFTAIPGTFEGPGASGAARQSDGKIVAVGSGNFSGQRRIILIRYNPNGSLDQTFGTNGIVPATYGGNETQAKKVAVQPDGSIVIVGYTGNSLSSPSVYRQFVARFTTSGAPDASFGSNGLVNINTENNSAGSSLALQPNGKILTGGAMAVGSSAAYLLARLNADGSLDTTFDEDGLKSVAFAGSFFTNSGLQSLAVQSDGRILATALGNVLFRFETNGALDASFDVDGMRQALPGASDPYAVTVTPSGKITVAGYPTIPTFSPIVYQTARYLPNGAPDVSYSEDGFLDIDVMPSFADGATAAAFDSQGRLVLAGVSGMGQRLAPFENGRFSVARLLAASSRPVSFAGRITYPNGKPINGATLALKRGDETIAVGRSNPFGYYRFRNVPSGQTYDLSVRAKNTTFPARTVLVDDEINDFLIVGEKSPRR